MKNIVARWEWRAFGQEFGPAEPRLAALTSAKAQISEEIYLLSTDSDANVKIRDQLLDIKILERVDANGLEQWRPVLKEPFPLGAAAVTQVRAALGLHALAPVADGLSLERLLEDASEGAGPVRVVRVRKARSRIEVQGCAGEVTDVIADGNKVRTVAIEDAISAKVIAAVRAMGLDRYPNTSYPRGLKQLIGLSSRGTDR